MILKEMWSKLGFLITLEDITKIETVSIRQALMNHYGVFIFLRKIKVILLKIQNFPFEIKVQKWRNNSSTHVPDYILCDMDDYFPGLMKETLHQYNIELHNRLSFISDPTSGGLSNGELILGPLPQEIIKEIIFLTLDTPQNYTIVSLISRGFYHQCRLKKEYFIEKFSTKVKQLYNTMHWGGCDVSHFREYSFLPNGKLNGDFKCYANFRDKCVTIFTGTFKNGKKVGEFLTYDPYTIGFDRGPELQEKEYYNPQGLLESYQIEGYGKIEIIYKPILSIQTYTTGGHKAIFQKVGDTNSSIGEINIYKKSVFVANYKTTGDFKEYRPNGTIRRSGKTGYFGDFPLMNNHDAEGNVVKVRQH